MKSGALPYKVPRLTFFAFGSLLTISCGSVAIWLSGGSSAMAIGNLVGCGIGLVAASATLVIPKIPKAAEMVFAVMIVALAATFADSGLSGMNRWISIGPLRANIAALFLAAFVAILCARQTRPSLAAPVWLSAMSLLVAQPDASQATALAIAAPLLFPKWPSKWRWPVLVATATLAALAATIISVRRADISAAALAAYCAVVAVISAFGHFPVPLAGSGISFPSGWWLGIAIVLRSHPNEEAKT